MVSDDRVKEIREGRVQRQQAAENAEMANKMAPAVTAGADAARLLSEADAGGGAGLLQQLGIG